jgi:hypothetical protein
MKEVKKDSGKYQDSQTLIGNIINKLILGYCAYLLHWTG